MLLLCPRTDARSTALAKPTLSVARVNHALARSMLSVSMSFPHKENAQAFLDSNRNSQTPLMMAPAHELYNDRDTTVLSACLPTGFLSNKDGVLSLYTSLRLRWLYAISATKIRFKSEMSIEELVTEIKKANSFTPTVLALSNDHGTVHDLCDTPFEEKSDRPGAFDEKVPEPAQPQGIRVKNIPLLLSPAATRKVLSTIWNDVPPVHLEPDGYDSMSVSFGVPNAEIANSFLSNPIKVLDHVWTFHRCTSLPDEQAEFQDFDALAQSLLTLCRE